MEQSGQLPGCRLDRHALPPRRGRQEHTLPRTERRESPLGVELEPAGEDGKEVAAVIHTSLPGLQRPNLIELEELAADEWAHGRSCVPLGRKWLDRLKAGDGLEASLDMKGPRLPIGPRAIPVKKPVGHIARLLDLSHEQSAANGMDGAGRNEDAVTGRRGNEWSTVSQWPAATASATAARSTHSRSPA